MNFKDYYNREKPTIYVDMDGVLCDFKNPITKALGKISYDEVTQEDVNEYFKTNDVKDFFANLPKYPYSDFLIRFIINKVGKYNICSRPMEEYPKPTIEGKNIWIDRELREKPEQRIFTFNKEDYAISEYAMGSSKPNILIDDWYKNIDAWKKAGGIAIQYDADEDSMEDLIKKLSKYMG